MSSAGSGKLLTELLLLATWLGAALLVVAVVAPAAFAVLPTRALAGALVGRILPVLFLSGLAIGVAVALLELIETRDRYTGRRALAGLALAVACVVTQFVIGARIDRARASIGPSLDALDAGDPRRAAFGRLHAASVAGLGVAMLAAGTALAVSLVALRSRS